MSDVLVKHTREGAVATVTLARPAKLNALTSGMLDALEVAARAIESDDAVRVVVLAAEGEKAFCVGADIHEWSALTPLDMWRRWIRRGHQVFDQWARLPQPVIVAINGHAFGGGLELAITGDIRVAVDAAQFALPEASIGTCPGWAGTHRLVKLIGASRAKYLALSGRRMDAAQALTAGLVHEVVPASALRTHVQALAQDMARQAPVSLQLTKQMVNAAMGEGNAEVLDGFAGAIAAYTEDGKEGVRSFRDKRAPQYHGR